MNKNKELKMMHLTNLPLTIAEEIMVISAAERVYRLMGVSKGVKTLLSTSLEEFTKKVIKEAFDGLPLLAGYKELKLPNIELKLPNTVLEDMIILDVVEVTTVVEQITTAMHLDKYEADLAESSWLVMAPISEKHLVFGIMLVLIRLHCTVSEGEVPEFVETHGIKVYFKKESVERIRKNKETVKKMLFATLEKNSKSYAALKDVINKGTLRDKVEGIIPYMTKEVEVEIMLEDSEYRFVAYTIPLESDKKQASFIFIKPDTEEAKKVVTLWNEKNKEEIKEVLLSIDNVLKPITASSVVGKGVILSYG